MGRRHAIAPAVEDAAGEDGLALGSEPLRVGVGGKLLLHGLEGGAVDDGLMLAGIDLASVLDLADINAVVQQVVDGTRTEGYAAYPATRARDADGRGDASLAKLGEERRGRAKLKVEAEDGADPLGFVRVDDKLPVLGR